MSIKWAAIIVGGMVLSSFLLLLLIQIVLAAGQPPQTHQVFVGNVTNGGAPVQDGLEVRVKAFDATLNRLVPIKLTLDSLDETGRHLTKDGTYGKLDLFQIPADNPETRNVREGAKSGDPLHFFVVTDAVRNLEVPARLLDVALGVEAESQQFVRFDTSRGTIAVDLAIIPPPVPIEPIGVITNDTPLFTWTPSASARPETLRYELQVVDSGGVVINAPDLTQTRFQTLTPLDDANYDWRVIATDSLEHEATSFVASFTVQTVPPEQVRNLDPLNFPPPAPPAPNQPPVAAAGADRTVDEGTTVTLNGGGSLDPDGDPITFSWTGPIALSGANTATPSFTAPDDGAFTFPAHGIRRRGYGLRQRNDHRQERGAHSGRRAGPGGGSGRRGHLQRLLHRPRFR